MIRVGTRGSALALAQAGWVAERFDDDTELVTVNATGPVDDKSRWVSELEHALLGNRIDIAVHSAKDVPAELPDGLALVAIPPRADPRDAICGAPSLDALAPGARVGTSSLRRSAQIRALRDDIEVVSVRGNVDTRVRKLGEGQVDALVLAAAGLGRLGLSCDGVLEQLIPAAGQGALALEARPGAVTIPAALADPLAAACLAAERELVRALGASCNTPVGAYARPVDGGLELRAWVGLPDGSAWLTDRVHAAADDGHGSVGSRSLGSLGSGSLGSGSLGSGLGSLVAERLHATGARELLRAAERDFAT